MPSFVNNWVCSNIVSRTFLSFFDFVFHVSEEQEFVFAINEVTFLLEKDFSIQSCLAVAIDKYQGRSKINLVLSGSSVGLIRKMLDGHAHTFGRFSHIHAIRPLDNYESSLFYPNDSSEDKFIAYAVFGGLSYFNSLIDSSKIVIENMKSRIIRNDSILEAELFNALLREAIKMDRGNAVVRRVAFGKRKQSDWIAAIGQIENADLKYLLNKLIEMDILEKTTPIKEKNNRKKAFFSKTISSISIILSLA